MRECFFLPRRKIQCSFIFIFPRKLFYPSQTLDIAESALLPENDLFEELKSDNPSHELSEKDQLCFKDNAYSD